MGESDCLVHPCSYASGISNDAKQENPIRVLGDSISFGRFTSESLSWEKWSSFSHKSYVEEAERYARPGSVAQKKAFFEAHYKSIAARKAADLLEQANAAKPPKPEFENPSSDISINHSQVPGNEQIHFVVNGSYGDNSNSELQKMENEKMEIESVDEKKPTPNSLHHLIYSSPAGEHDKSTAPTARVAPSPYKASKDDTSVLPPPTKWANNACTNGLFPSETPTSEVKRSRTPLDISAPGSKTTGPKWHILSAVCSKPFSACRNKLQSSTLSNPFRLRTEERAAIRKQKLEEKFNAKEGQKVQLQTRLKEKADTELRKLRQSLCFRAPSLHFYKERETPKDQIENLKTPFKHHNSSKLGTGKPSSSPLRGITSLPPETPSTKKSWPNSFLKKKSQITNPHSWLPEMIITHENTFPNIQH